jgi:hypothetical protein
MGPDRVGFNPEGISGTHGPAFRFAIKTCKYFLIFL